MARKMVSGLLGAAATGGVLVALLWLERRYPLRKGKPEPDLIRVPRNVGMAAVTTAVVSLCERPLVGAIAERVDRRQVGLLPRLGMHPALETAMGVILLDYSLYWWHILLHRVPFLWRSHLVHHSDLILDTSTALRFHWLEFLASIPWRLAQVAVIGIRPSTLRLWQRLTLIEVLFHHSNLRLPLRTERLLGRLVVTPRLHGIHHSTVREERDSNFSSGLTLWDILHGTLRRDIPQEAIEIGVPGYRHPMQLGLPGMLTLPFRVAPS